MSQTVRLHQIGGLEGLRLERTQTGAPGPGEVRIRQAWAGVNFVDIYHRIGLYPLPQLPVALGVEAAGVVEALGEGVEGLSPGQRVAWAGLPVGGYAQHRLIRADRLLALPDAISGQTAAASLLRGITTHMLLHQVRPVGAGDTVLVQAAAGGLGLMLTHWAKRLGARVIGTVGSEAKAEIALRAGLDHAILHRREDFVAAVRRLTDGGGVDVAFDGVGGETLTRTLDCVRPFGLVASVGQASGALPRIALEELGPRRSLAIARPSVLAYMADLARYRAAARALFEHIEAGMAVTVGATYPLSEAAEAQRAIESGETTGSVLLDLA